MPTFKSIVVRTNGHDKFAAIDGAGRLWETYHDAFAPHPKKTKWRQLATGDMRLPVLSLAVGGSGEALVALDRDGAVWKQDNDGLVAERGVYQWRRIEFAESEDH